jgi:hypothetical protein
MFSESLPSNVLIQSVILLLRACFEVSVAQQFLHGVNNATIFRGKNRLSAIHICACLSAIFGSIMGICIQWHVSTNLQVALAFLAGRVWLSKVKNVWSFAM